MQRFLRILIFLCFVGKSVVGLADVLPPTASMTMTPVSGDLCQNSTAPVITFSGSGGTAPYTFSYTINGTPQTITTTTGSSVTLNAPTAIPGMRTYTLTSVADNTGIPVAVSGTVGFTVLAQPDATMNATAEFVSNFAGFDTFRVCQNSAAAVDFFNASATSGTLNTGYTINWGDGSPNFSGSTWTSQTHTYSVGLWTLTYTITSQNGCNITKIYKVFVGNNPAVGLGNPGNTDVCIDAALTFPITGAANNPPGTTYIVTFNDGSTPITYNHPPPATVTHTFLTGSCGTSSTSGSTVYPNSFYANIRAINPCDESSATVVPIRISTIPTANFNLPAGNHCINTPICFTNNSTGGDTATSGGCNDPKIIWSVSPSTGFSISSGSLGNDFGNTNTNAWTSGSAALCLNFSVAGTYTVMMKIGSRCGIDTKVQTICVSAPLTPQFTLNTNNGCTPLAVTATNTTNMAVVCGTASQVWSVSYAAGFCGSGAVSVPNQNTANASYNFSQPGTYTITLTTTTNCGTTAASQTVVVKKPPTVTLSALPNLCGSGTISPQATVNSCAPATSSVTYSWSFPGGTPATSSMANPGAIAYTTPGNYTISLVVGNECGNTTAATQSFTVNAAPAITNSVLAQTVCSGTTSQAINLTASIPGTTFTWSGTGTAGVSGFQASGSGALIPAQTLSYNGTGVGTVTYTVTPSISGCAGIPTVFQIQVTPAPVVTTQPQSQDICQGAVANTLSIALANAPGTPSYQWYINTTNSTIGGTAISGETNANFTPPTPTMGTFHYYVIVSLSSGGCSALSSQVATINVLAPPQVTTQPLGTQSVCIGASVPALTIQVSGAGGSPTYQWYANNNASSTGGTAIPGANAAAFTPAVFNTSGTFYYYAVVNFSIAGCSTVSSQSAEVVVVNDPTINVQPMVLQTLCQGAAPQNLEVQAAGGLGAFSYQWYSNTVNASSGGSPISGATGYTFTPPTSLVGTTYYYVVVSQPGLGCSAHSAVATVTVNASPSVSLQPVSTQVCLGGSAAALNFSTLNGAGTASYQWFVNTSNNNTGGSLIPGATNATYTPPTSVVGLQWYYCEILFSGIVGTCATVVTQPAEINVTPNATVDTQPTPTQSLCVGGSLVSALSVSYVGGAGIPTYQWYVNTLNSTVGGVPVGGNSSSYLPAVFNTPGTFYYYVALQFSGSGCSSVVSDIAEVVVVPDPTVDSQPLASQTLCPGEIAVPLLVSVSGGIGSTYTYQWYVATSAVPGSGVLISGATAATYTPPTGTTGTYYYYCEIQQPILSCGITSGFGAVNVSAAPTVGIQPLPQTICSGQPIAPLSFAVVNGVGTPVYQWFGNNVAVNSGGTAIPGANAASYLPNGTAVGTFFYYCEIQFPGLSGGCSQIVTDAVMISIEQNPIITNTSDTICSGNAFLVVPQNTGSNVVPTGTLYTWDTPVIFPAGSLIGGVAQNVPQSSVGQILINTTTTPATATYTITPVSGNCAGQPFTVVITVNPAIAPNLVLQDNLCFGANNASITTNATGGIPFSGVVPYLYSWTGPNGFVAATPSVSNLAPGIYDLTITDAGGCPFIASYTISEPMPLAFSSTTLQQVTCNGAANGSISIAVNGGSPAYSFSWTKDTAFFSNSQNLTGLAPGIYEVTVSDVHLCGPIVMSFSITEPAPLTASVVSQVDIDCFGAATGSLSVLALGGTPSETTPGVFEYQYSWSGPAGFVSTQQNISGLIAGVYNLVVTDANLCVLSLSATLTQSPEILISHTATAISCYGANDANMSVSLTGGVGPYTFTWSNLATTLNQTNLSAGDYTITVTDALGCVKSKTINIPEAPVFMVSPEVTQISCDGANDGSIQLNLTGGIAPVTLVWSDGSPAGLTRNALGPGTYTATITDGKPCQILRTFVIVNPAPLAISALVDDANDCNNALGGSVDLTVSGGTPPYTYNWSNGATTEDISLLTNGNYAVTVTDTRGCTIQRQFSVQRPDPILITVNTQTDFNCETHQVAQHFIAQVSGGIPPFLLQWSSGTISGVNQEIMHTNTNGLVNITATDSRGCTATYSLIVDIPELGYIGFIPQSYGNQTYGIFSIQDPVTFASQLSGDFQTVIWDFGDGTTSNEINPVHTYVAPGSYVVTQTVTYPFGCQYKHLITLLVEEGFFLTMPTGFTPNNDGINDTYRPVFKRLERMQMDIYDSWGSKIYTEKGETLVGWNGTVRGSQAENGNYYCIVTAATFYGKTITATETFVLIK